MGYADDEHWEEALGDAWESTDNLREDFDNDIWTTRDHTKIALTRMKTSHIRNAINHINHRGDDCCFGFGGRWLKKLQRELAMRRGMSE